MTRQLAENDDAGVRQTIAKRPRLSAEIVEQLAEDAHWSVRRAIAERSRRAVTT